MLSPLGPMAFGGCPVAALGPFGGGGGGGSLPAFAALGGGGGGRGAGGGGGGGGGLAHFTGASGLSRGRCGMSFSVRPGDVVAGAVAPIECANGCEGGSGGTSTADAVESVLGLPMPSPLPAELALGATGGAAKPEGNARLGDAASAAAERTTARGAWAEPQGGEIAIDGRALWSMGGGASQAGLSVSALAWSCWRQTRSATAPPRSGRLSGRLSVTSVARRGRKRKSSMSGSGSSTSRSSISVLPERRSRGLGAGALGVRQSSSSLAARLSVSRRCL